MEDIHSEVFGNGGAAPSANVESQDADSAALSAATSVETHETPVANFRKRFSECCDIESFSAVAADLKRCRPGEWLLFFF